MKVSIVYFLSLVSLVFSGCVKVAQDVEPPKIESQLVVFSFLSPEEKLVKVEVSRSKPVYGNAGGSIAVINNATVTITNDGGQSVALVYSDSLDSYVVSQQVYKIEAGRTYTVRAMWDEKTTTGSCTVPADTIPLTEWTSKSLDQSAANLDGPRYIYTYKWTDKPGIRNYYLVDIDLVHSYSSWLGDTVIYVENIGSTVWDDENRDGGLLTGTTEDYSNPSSGGVYKIYLLNTDIHYFEYHRRRLSYYGDNPFSEPFQQYNNVEGGLGVVCAYRKTSRTLRVE